MAPSQTTFEFVSITSSAPVLSAAGRGLIKKHVMKDIGRARRRYKWDEADKVPGIRVSEECSTPSTRQSTSPSTTNSSSSADDDEPVQFMHDFQRMSQLIVTAPKPRTEMQDSERLSQLIVTAPEPRTILGAGHVDPFVSFPVQDEADVFLLVDHINDDSHASFKLFREYWFPLSLQNPAAFRCILALAAQHRKTLYPDDKIEQAHRGRQYVAHYAAAIHSVNKRVANLAQTVSDDTIAAILLLACDHAASNAAKNYMQHMNGLKAIIELRGGIATLDSNKSLRLLLFWIDTLGAAALGISPKFPAPTRYLPDFDTSFHFKLRPRLPGPVSEEWLTVFPSHLALIEVFDDLCALAVMVENEALTKQPVQEPRFTGFYILPLVHRLSMLRSGNTETLQGDMIFEACKLSAFLYLQLLRRFVARRYPCVNQPFFESKEGRLGTWIASCVRKLELTMAGHATIWTALQPLKCWALTIGASSSHTMREWSIHFADLEDLVSNSSYNHWCNSMGPLLSNSWLRNSPGIDIG